jgi:hypothetical protein
MNGNCDIAPFANCPSLDGYHCQTNSLAKIFRHYGHPLSEEMILGLGAGMGFIYWTMSNNKHFFHDLGQRTGVTIRLVSTSSAKKAETSLVAHLANAEPVMMFGDMGFLPWFKLPEEYHFGGHTFVICGYNGKNTVLASDIDQTASGLKQGFYYPITLEQLRKARGSTFKPFPPKNVCLEFDFTHFHAPQPEDVLASIAQTVESQLHPPIRNFGVKGLRHTSKEITNWSNMFTDHELRMNLFNLYIFIEIGGTGGGCFRYMYSRFLQEAMDITGNSAMAEAAEIFQVAGAKFTEIGVLFKDVETMRDIDNKIQTASHTFAELADLEETAYLVLTQT